MAEKPSPKVQSNIYLKKNSLYLSHDLEIISSANYDFKILLKKFVCCHQ